MSDTIRIGVSACVVGEKVRWDGSHKRDPYLTEILSKYVEYVPLCPEIACGLGIPREKLRQVDCAGEVRLIGYESGDDMTDTMSEWADKVLPSLEDEELCGFILKNKSPSCGLTHARIHSTDGKPPRRGSGFFAHKLKEHAPFMPLATTAQLQNPIVRENFIRRVFVLHRWRALLAKGLNIGRLVDFHTRHKMLIRAHDIKGYRELGKLLGESNIFNADEIFDTYAVLLFKSLTLKATPAKVSDVLMHAMGYFKKDIGESDKRELLTMIADYKNGSIPLLVPVTIINHYARKYQKPYLSQQYFLNPAPTEVKLLNHV